MTPLWLELEGPVLGLPLVCQRAGSTQPVLRSSFRQGRTLSPHRSVCFVHAKSLLERGSPAVPCLYLGWFGTLYLSRTCGLQQWSFACDSEMLLVLSSRGASMPHLETCQRMIGDGTCMILLKAVIGLVSISACAAEVMCC